jgi:hypothetical protein
VARAEGLRPAGALLLGCDELGPRRARGAELGQKLRGEEKSFSFSFQNFQSNFQMDFEFSFVFESNHSIHEFQCNSMSAQSCS